MKKNDSKDVKKEPSKGGGLQGWLCPACGKGNSPYNMTCPCTGWNRPYVYPKPYTPIQPWYEQPYCGPTWHRGDIR